ncbi:uncharacterized protein FOMMEDRAFT_160333 [Fomitiporia mediterranea MF3/22]|uniref:uncharacterized protein n=1 Tax=Fomitiporia mediterranea (strain MF3/22) TaxID=694068 RepID=UPI0004407D80|nr:uncharacterized protein FOMMEDRAFT_160333 [Fomitiporia mediterranea MF3/22]EJC99878.1 hypothetical protein FOMMEDRAFT_160333 [Fomitiporia mediterranea MF3/22]
MEKGPVPSTILILYKLLEVESASRSAASGTGADGSIRETALRISISTDNLSADEIPTDTAVPAYPQKTAGNLRD